ncbi:MAG: hypothetical protein ACK5QC_04700 [Bacteroidota bacterium]
MLDQSIIHYTYLAGAEVEIKNAIMNHELFMNFAPSKPGLIIDSEDGLVQISTESVGYIRSMEPSTPLVGRAFVTNSLANQLMISIFYKKTPSLYPVKVFRDYLKALQWLLELENRKFKAFS